MESKEAINNIVLSAENLTSSILDFDLVCLKNNLLKPVADIADKIRSLSSEIIVVCSSSLDCIVIKKKQKKHMHKSDFNNNKKKPFCLCWEA